MGLVQLGKGHHSYYVVFAPVVGRLSVQSCFHIIRHPIPSSRKKFKNLQFEVILRAHTEERSLSAANDIGLTYLRYPKDQLRGTK